MKTAIIAVIALVVLGGVGYAIYTLTDVTEQTQEWWDEQKLDNFETLANRELDDFEKKIAEHEKVLKTLKADRIKWAGHPKFDGNEKIQDTKFMTLLGYENLIEHRGNQGKALGDAYQAAAAADGAVINADTGELAGEALISVDVPQRDGTFLGKEMKAEAVLDYLDTLETELIELEANRDRLGPIVKQFDSAVAAWEEQLKVEKEELVDLRKDVARIATEIKLQKAKEDLDDLLKGINGEGGKSALGSLINKYEQRKSKFQREKLVEGDQQATKPKVSLDDLDKTTTADKPRKSRFLSN